MRKVKFFRSRDIDDLEYIVSVFIAGRTIIDMQFQTCATDRFREYAVMIVYEEGDE